MWNPAPTVCAARDFGNKFARQQVIILSIDLIKGTLQMDSYGQTKRLCDEAKKLGDVAYEAVMQEMAKRK